ncbi:ABC transporter permease subunit [Clostridioides sp. ZZV15-6598]|uniref:ABC transporter permease n=1 Tax=Clostridioides sp. ZZV15-6598 TaxID=2811501 RepID=UPI001D1231FC|nr:ABC transporter permease subunit [Clostridioides sp. ZZV15-6598]
MSKKFNIILNIMFVVIIAPIILLAVWGVVNTWPFPNILPKEFSLRGFRYILDISNLNIILRSIIISITVVLITILLSIPASKALALYNFKGKRFCELLILSPIIIPLISVAMGIHIAFIRIGLANNILGVIIINILPCIPYSVRIITDVYKLIGDNLEIQAKVLGASKFNTFRYVTFPLILPGILGASSMSFIISFSQYFLTLLIGGGSVITYPMIMFPYIQSGDRTIASLYSMLFLIISLFILIIIEYNVKKKYKHIQNTRLF